MGIIIMDTKEKVLQNCIIQNNVVKLPEGEQLDRKTYLEVKKAIELIGGKWKGGKVFGFVFDKDPTELIQQIASGVKRNIKKEFQFYGTPEKLCNILCEHAFDPYRNKSINILEPSAGQGAIIDSILKWFDTEAMHLQINEITAIEYMAENHQILIDKYSDNDKINILNMDFLEYDEYINYFDVVIANPPFSKAQDIKHFYKMYEVCKPDGIIVSIMSNGFLHNSQKLFQEFREFLGLPYNAQTRYAAKGGCTFSSTSKDGLDEQVFVQTFDAGEFKESGTNVHSALIVMKKHTLSGFDAIKPIPIKEEIKQLSIFE